MLLWLSTFVQLPPEELGHAVQSSGPLAQVQYESTGLLVLDDGSRTNAVSGKMCREGTVVGGLILLSSEGVRGGDGEQL